MKLRFATSLLTLVLASLASFLAVEFAPGDRAELLLGGASAGISSETLARFRERHGLDQPVALRYLAWLRSLWEQRLGVSLKTGRPVLEEFRVRIPVSAALAAGALTVGSLAGLAFGLLCVRFQDRWPDHGIRLLASACQSAPVFLIGLFALYLLSFRFGWFPLYGAAGGGLVLPIGVLGGTLACSLSRVVRNALLQACHQEYFLAALAKGLSFGQALLRHAVPNIGTLVITYLGMRMASLLGGVVLIESVFSLPGMGGYILEAILSRDYPVIQAYLLFACTVVLVANFSVDVLARRLDPRAAQFQMV